MLCIVMILIDQLLKYFIYVNRPEVVLVPGILNITYAQNTGMLFGLAQGSNTALIISSMIIVVLLFIVMRKMGKYSIQRKLWQLILAGGISNLIDRIFRGFVIDYAELKFFGVCNLADFCIVAGVILLAIQEIKELVHNKK